MYFEFFVWKKKCCLKKWSLYRSAIRNVNLTWTIVNIIINKFWYTCIFYKLVMYKHYRYKFNFFFQNETGCIFFYIYISGWINVWRKCHNFFNHVLLSSFKKCPFSCSIFCIDFSKNEVYSTNKSVFVCMRPGKRDHRFQIK